MIALNIICIPWPFVEQDVGALVYDVRDERWIWEWEGPSFIGLRQGNWSWARVAQGSLHQLVWILHKIIKEEVEKL